jgi:hypothetical protein
MRKPFDVLAEGLVSEKNRGDRISTGDLLHPKLSRSRFTVRPKALKNACFLLKSADLATAVPPPSAGIAKGHSEPKGYQRDTGFRPFVILSPSNSASLSK